MRFLFSKEFIMPIIKPVNGKSPQIPDDCYIAENATIVGDVIMGTQCSVWFSAVIRGDVPFMIMFWLVWAVLLWTIAWWKATALLQQAR